MATEGQKTGGDSDGRGRTSCYLRLGTSGLSRRGPYFSSFQLVAFSLWPRFNFQEGLCRTIFKRYEFEFDDLQMIDYRTASAITHKVVNTYKGLRYKGAQKRS
ncbi:hypothetical protein A0H81_08994 [Grifola frondosa]|uniref:Uncharacterized protein n=1 Tax=Grifola frondosa TaxID=5627 RepID=A0A1C7M2H8_GRIFR|nr:hypothetical protein A0H81_08994 [Grifola frondosa]